MKFDVIIVGGGHAGAEAAAAAARLGAKTALLTSNLDTISQMSCNPAIGGVAKGQIVREVDALGGLMGEVIDATGIQFRMLNRSKGPAMHGPRAQADKKAYQFAMKERLENLENLELHQELVEELLVEQRPDGKPFVTGVKTMLGEIYEAPRVVLTTGTFLRGILHYGPNQFPGGRAGDMPANKLSQTLERAGIRLARFKTGTPARLNGRTIDYSNLSPHVGDEDPVPFSFLHETLQVEQIPCWITRTNAKVHQISAKISTARRCTPARSTRPGRGTARRSRRRSCVSPTKKATSFTSSPRAGTRWRFTSTVFPRAFRATSSAR